MKRRQQGVEVPWSWTQVVQRGTQQHRCSEGGVRKPELEEAEGPGNAAMVPRDPDDTDPGGRPKGDAVEAATDPDPQRVVTYDPPTDNERIRFIFENMETRRAPAPIDAPVTNGELHASYSTTHQAQPRNLTPTSQPPVVVAPDEPPAPARPAPGRNDPTVRIVRDEAPPVVLDRAASRRRLVVASIVGAAALLLLAAIVVSLSRGEAPSSSTSTASAIPAVETAPSIPSSIRTAVASSLSTVVEVVPPAPAASTQASPAPSSVPSPTPKAKTAAPSRSVPKAQPSSDDFYIME